MNIKNFLFSRRKKGNKGNLKIIIGVVFLSFLILALFIYFNRFSSVSAINEEYNSEMRYVRNELRLYSLTDTTSTNNLTNNKEIPFGSYKYKNNSNIIISTLKDTVCYWKPDKTDDGYKLCEAVFVIENKNPTASTIPVLANFFNFTFKKNVVNLSYTFSNAYTLKDYSYPIGENITYVTTSREENNSYYDEELNKTIINITIVNETTEIRNPDIMNTIQLKDFSSFKAVPIQIDTSKPFAVKVTFAVPKYSSNSFNLSLPVLTSSIDPDISDCGTLSTVGGVYTLNQSVNSTGTCFTISASDVTLDCAGYTINYSTAGTASTYGVVSNQFNSTVKNCIIISGNDTGNTNRHGIYWNSADNGTIQNNTATVYNGTSSYGIHLFGGADYNLITLNTGISNKSFGIYLSSSINNTFISNNGTSNISVGIQLYLGMNNTLISNTGQSNTGAGIHLDTSSKNDLNSNNGTSNTNYGINLQTTSNNNTLTSNNGTSNTNFGIRLASSHNNTLIGNNGTSNTNNGIKLDTASNNTLTGNNGTSNISYGIYQSGGSGNNFTSNIGMSNSSYGIYLTSSNNNILTSNNGTSNTSSGIYLNSASNNNTLTSNIGISNISAGIYLNSASNNNTLTSNIGISNTSIGIYLSSSSNNNLTSNNGTSNTGYGIRIVTCSNNTLISNIGISNISYGIATENCLNNTLLGNIGISNTSIGIYLSSSSNNNLTSNNGTSNTNRGIYILSSSNNTLTSNIGTSNISYGIRLELSSNNTLISNIGISNTSYGIYLTTSSNNTLTSNTARGLLTGSYGYYILNESGTIIQDCVNTSGIDYDVYVHSTAGTNVTFINCSYNISKETVTGATNILTRKWYYQANVSTTTDIPLDSANVSAYNSTGVMEFSVNTTATGIIPIQQITDYVNRGGTRNYTYPHTINASATGYTTGSHSFNASLGNNLTDTFKLSFGGDLTKPYFITIPANASLFYGNESLGVWFNATDETGFGNYTINDSRFLINQSGYLNNASPMVVGNYEINVTINDTSNNINWTRYTIQINKSMSQCQVFFNETSPLNHPNTFRVWTNCTTTFVLSRNGTIISNNSEQSLSVSAYNFSLQRTDTSNYTFTYNDSEFRIVDTTNPTGQFVSPTPNNLDSLEQNYIYTNVTASDSNGIKNITTYIYNSSLDLVSSITNNTVTIAYNEFISLPYTFYYINATVFDNNDNSYNVATRNISLFADATLPTITVFAPTNSTYTSTTVNLNTSCADANGIDLYWYKLDGGSNVFFIPNTTVTTTGYETYHNLMVSCNDTFGNVNNVARRFYVGAVTPAPSGTGTANTCRYKKFGYYNDDLAFFKGVDCV